MKIRKAEKGDISAVAEIYELIHDDAEAGKYYTGWIRGVYPTCKTASAGWEKGELFVMEDEDSGIVAAARINRVQDDAYKDGVWQYDAGEDEVMVLHTLVVSPHFRNRGYASDFVRFYEDYAGEHSSTVLRMDTNEKNTSARRLYARLGYREAGIVSCEFNGISSVNLVLLEKKV